MAGALVSPPSGRSRRFVVDRVHETWPGVPCAIHVTDDSHMPSVAPGSHTLRADFRSPGIHAWDINRAPAVDFPVRRL
jgi:hypothetical protein